MKRLKFQASRSNDEPVKEKSSEVNLPFLSLASLGPKSCESMHVSIVLHLFFLDFEH